MDLARDLLGQHPGRDHRARADRAAPSRRTTAHRRRSTGAARSWSPAGWGSRCSACSRSSDVGLGRRRDLALHRRRAAAAGRRSSRSSCAPGEPLIDVRIFARPRLRGRQRRAVPAVGRLRPAVLLREPLRADLARRDASEAGLYLLVFFGGFGAVSQSAAASSTSAGPAPRSFPAARSPRSASASGPAALPDLDLSNQWYFIVIAGAGVGLVLGPASTDALNRAPRASYGEVTGITQTRATSARAWASPCWGRS